MIDISKLSPAPWYFVTPLGDELETLVFNDHDEDTPVLSPLVVGSDSCDQNWDFIALARNAFDVMMRRGWVPKRYLGYMWSVQNGHGDYPPELLGMVDTPEPAVWLDPFTALASADEWLKAQEAKGGTK